MDQLIAQVSAGLERVTERIEKAGGDPGRITVVAVTKGFGADAVRAALAAGCTDIGENYGDELLTKAAGGIAARVHFLGAVQRNKVARLAPLVDVWQSVDREEEGTAISSRAPSAKVFVQVDLSPPGITGRAGAPVPEVAPLVGRLRAAGVGVEGLMAVGPPPPADPEPGFRQVAELAGALELPEISMGMSGDLEVAVRSGATMVRIGRALFGDRPAR